MIGLYLNPWVTAHWYEGKARLTLIELGHMF
jgi:hypothetical protein